MGFRLGSFLAGMAEGAIEIEEDVRKRNEKIIDATLEANANRRTEEMQARREREREYKLLAKKLSSLDGMDDNKINLVLSYGIDEAKTFAEMAPKAKNLISHRFNALKGLHKNLIKHLETEEIKRTFFKFE